MRIKLYTTAIKLKMYIVCSVLIIHVNNSLFHESFIVHVVIVSDKVVEIYNCERKKNDEY